MFRDIKLKANGWAEVNFDVATGSSNGVFNDGGSGGGSPNRKGFRDKL